MSVALICLWFAGSSAKHIKIFWIQKAFVWVSGGQLQQPNAKNGVGSPQNVWKLVAIYKKKEANCVQLWGRGGGASYAASAWHRKEANPWIYSLGKSLDAVQAQSLRISSGTLNRTTMRWQDILCISQQIPFLLHSISSTPKTFLKKCQSM